MIEASLAESEWSWARIAVHGNDFRASAAHKGWFSGKWFRRWTLSCVPCACSKCIGPP